MLIKVKRKQIVGALTSLINTFDFAFVISLILWSNKRIRIHDALVFANYTLCIFTLSGKCV